jgi:hypothetical protein
MYARLPGQRYGANSVNIAPQRGKRDTHNSMGAERRRRRGQTKTIASHTRHTHIRQALDPPTQASQGNRTTGNRGQGQTTSAERHEWPRNGARLDTRVRVYKPDRARDALPWPRATPSSTA